MGKVLNFVPRSRDNFANHEAFVLSPEVRKTIEDACVQASADYDKYNKRQRLDLSAGLFAGFLVEAGILNLFPLLQDEVCGKACAFLGKALVCSPSTPIAVSVLALGATLGCAYHFSPSTKLYRDLNNLRKQVLVIETYVDAHATEETSASSAPVPEPVRNAYRACQAYLAKNTEG